MKKKILSLLTVASLAFFACSSDEAETADPQGGLNLLVKDANSNQPLAAASAMLIQSGQIKITDAQGVASFSGISGGSYFIRVEKDGYATYKKGTYVPGIGFNNEDIQLYELSTLTGYLYYTDDNGTRKPATGATVRVILSDDSFEDKIIEQEVGADGKYTLKVPAVSAVGYTVIALEHIIDGVSYEQRTICSTSCQSLALGSINKLTDRTYSSKSTAGVGGEFRLLEDGATLELADLTQAVVLHFTDSIDIAKSSIIEVTDGSSDLAADITYSDGNKTVTITPLGGKWAAAPKIDISKVTSGKGKSILNLSVTTRPKTPKFNLNGKTVTGLAKTSNDAQLATNGNTVTLQWDMVEGATGYNIYAKAKTGSNTYARIYSEAILAACGSPTTTNLTTRKVTIDLSFDACAEYATALGLSLVSDSVWFVVQAEDNVSNTKTLLNGVQPGPAVAVFPLPPPVADSIPLLISVTPNDEGLLIKWRLISGATKYKLYLGPTEVSSINHPKDTTTIAWGTSGIDKTNFAAEMAVFTVRAVGRIDTDMSGASNEVRWPVDISGEIPCNISMGQKWGNWFDMTWTNLLEDVNYKVEVFNSSDLDNPLYSMDCDYDDGTGNKCTSRADPSRPQTNNYTFSGNPANIWSANTTDFYTIRVTAVSYYGLDNFVSKYSESFKLQ